jgi:hypothetical protein
MLRLPLDQDLAMRRCASVCALTLLLAPASALAQPPASAAGRVKVAAGAASIVRGGQTAAAAVGDRVFESAQLRTGLDGRLSVMLKDDSRVSLGPNSELALTRFAFSPADAELGLGLRLARGVLSYVSGLIATLAPEAVRLQTPTSIIGVRGTHVLVRTEAP